MKKLANLLMMLGAIIAVISFNMDVTAGDSGIVNMNMMAQRQNLLIVGCVAFLAGIVLLVGGQRQANSNAQPPVPEQDAHEASATSAKSAVMTFWKQRDTGGKLVLASAILLILSFCFPWEVSSVIFATGPYDISRTWIEISQAAVGLALWVYPCLVSVGRARLNSNGLRLNVVVAALWIGSVAYKFHNFHKDMAEQTAIQMRDGVGFWLGLVACVVLIAGILKIVKDSSVTKDAELAPEA